MISGTVYGVVLNDRAEQAALAGAFVEPPYKAPASAACSARSLRTTP